MDVIGHSLLMKLTENGFSISQLTKEFIDGKLNNSLYKIIIKEKLPDKNLDYAILHLSI